MDAVISVPAELYDDGGVGRRNRVPWALNIVKQGPDQSMQTLGNFAAQVREILPKLQSIAAKNPDYSAEINRLIGVGSVFAEASRKAGYFAGRIRDIKREAPTAGDGVFYLALQELEPQFADAMANLKKWRTQMLEQRLPEARRETEGFLP